MTKCPVCVPKASVKVPYVGLGSDDISKGTECTGASGLGIGDVDGTLFKARLSGVMKSRWFEHGGGDGRS